MPPLIIHQVLAYDARHLQILFVKKELNSVNLIKVILAHIKQQDREGLNLRAVCSLAPEKILLERAAYLDREREEGRSLGHLHGIPISIKVCPPANAVRCCIKNAIRTLLQRILPDLGMPTTVGSFALLNSKPGTSATIIEKVTQG